MSEDRDEASYMPGPWQVENLTKAAEESWFNIVEGHRGFTVAEAVGDRATARLIAAAPEMLDALKACEALVGMGAPPPDWDWIRGIIAKVEGKQP